MPGASYELVIDSGCLHHLAPHRRVGYLERLPAWLGEGGSYGIVTFARGLMGTEADDLTLLRDGGLAGGVGYDVDDLTALVGPRGLRLVQGGPMPAQEDSTGPDGVAGFGADFLVAALFRR